MKRRSLLFVGVLFVALFAVGVARAEEDSSTNGKTQTAQEIFKWINFAIVAGGVILGLRQSTATEISRKRGNNPRRNSQSNSGQGGSGRAAA